MPKLKQPKPEIKSTLRPTFLAGFSMGSYYHEAADKIIDQIKAIQNKNPETIYTFLADIQHYQTELVKDLLEKPESYTEANFNAEKNNLESEYLEKCSTQGEEWIKKFGRYIGYQEMTSESQIPLAPLEDSSAYSHQGTSDKEVCYLEYDPMLDDTEEKDDSESENYVAAVDFNPWGSFDQDANERLVKNKSEVSKEGISDKGELNNNHSIDDSLSSQSTQTTSEDMSVASEEGGDDTYCNPDYHRDDLKHMLYNSIYFNSMEYYLNGIKSILNDEIKKRESIPKEKASSSEVDARDELETFKTNTRSIVERIDVELKNIEVSIKKHNERLADYKITNIYSNNAYDGSKAEKVNFSKNFAKSILNDITTYLCRRLPEKYEFKSNDKKDLIYLSDWRVQTALLYSAKHQTQNLASIGIYSLVHGITYFTYPRQLGNSPLMFTNNVLRLLINELYNDNKLKLEYRKLLTYKYHDGERDYPRHEVNITFDANGNQVASLKTNGDSLIIVNPEPAQQKIISPHSSISKEVVEKMRIAITCAKNVYVDRNKNDVKTHQKIVDLENLAKEKSGSDQSIVITLLSWADFEVERIKEYFTSEDRNQKQNIEMILFILVLCHEILSDSNNEIDIRADKVRKTCLTQYFATFLVALDSNKIKDNLDDIVNKIKEEAGSSAMSTIRKSCFKPFIEKKSNKISDSFVKTAKYFQQTIDQIMEKKLNEITPTKKQTTPPVSPGRSKSSVVSLFPSPPAKDGSRSKSNSPSRITV